MRSVLSRVSGHVFSSISLICRLIGLSNHLRGLSAARLSTASGSLDNHKRDITKLAA